MTASAAHPGYYIVVEGHDGTGKSTQIELLAAWLQTTGRDVVVVEEPGSDDPAKATPVANELRRVIKNGQLVRAPEVNLALFSAARRELWQQRIQPALKRGAVVLSSRNYFSTIAYQGYGEGLDVAEIERMTAVFTDERYLQPDGAVVLLASDRVRQQRIVARGEDSAADTFESREAAFQQRVHQGYQQLAANKNIPVVVSEGAPQDVQRQIIAKLAFLW